MNECRYVSAYVMRHLRRYHHRQLHEAGNLAVAPPGCLEDELVQPVLLDGIGVGLAGGEHVAYLLLRPLRVVLHQVVADDVAVTGESLARAVVHVQYFGVSVTDSDSRVYFVRPMEQVFGYLSHVSFF